MVHQEHQSKEREVLILEGELKNLDLRTKCLEDRCVAISQENRELQMRIGELEDDNRANLARHDASRKKMEAYKAAVMQAASQTEAYKELQERREQVKMLTLKKEELRDDLDNPNGSMVQESKVERTVRNR